MLIAVSTVVWADEPSSTSTVTFNIPQQAADRALTLFAEQADLTLIFPPELVGDKKANELIGTYTHEEGAKILLDGTGLAPSFSNEVVMNVTIDDTSSGGEKAMNATKKAGLVAIIAGTLAGGVDAQEPAVTETEIQTSVVTGTVTDARTGANLEGAKVTIEETGQWVSTNELGRFRFASVPEGNATLTVSFLGYAGQSAAISIRGSTAEQNFSLRGGSEIEEIVVFGQRSARAIALNQQRTAENSTTVLSSDVLGQFEGATLAETLRRAPGVTFQEDSLTGEGTNIIIRGLEPDLNQIRLDGQRLAEDSGVGRSAAIGLLLTDSIDEVTISRTLLPSQDSAGSGGLVEITTKGPLDRDRRFLSARVEGLTNDGFRDAVQMSGVGSVRFGKGDNFGVSLSLQFRDETVETVGFSRNLSGFGPYLPLTEGGTPITNIRSLNPLLQFPFETGVDEVYPESVGTSQNTVGTERLAGTATLQWAPTPNLEMRLAYTRTEQDRSTAISDNSLAFDGAYQPLFVDEVGEIRGTYVVEDRFVRFGDPGLLGAGVTLVNRQARESVTDVLSFEGAAFVRRWELGWRLSRSTGSSESDRTASQFVVSVPELQSPVLRRLRLPEEFLLDEALNNTVQELIVSPFAPISGSGYQAPLLNQAGFDFFSDPANYGLSRAGATSNRSDGSNELGSIAFDARREFNEGPLSYLEVGAEFERAEFETNGFDSVRYSLAVPSISLTELGITAFEADNLSAIGVDSRLRTLSEGQVTSFFASLDGFTNGDTPLLTRTVTPTADIFNDQGTEEEDFSVYIQGRLDWRDFELIGGFRYSKVDIAARFVQAPSVFEPGVGFDPDFTDRESILVDGEASQESILPRFLLNYRPKDNLVVRAGYYESIARPRVEDLSGPATLFFFENPIYGPSNDQPGLFVFQKNPELEPAKTKSYDLAVSLYDDNAGLLEASVFYKEIENSLEFTRESLVTASGLDAVADLTLPDDPRFSAEALENVFVQIDRPVNNNEAAEIWGFELVAERQFVSLPGAWGGLGIIGNYTYSDSEKFFIFEDIFNPDTLEFVDIEASGVPFDQSPKHSGTIGVTYNKYGVDASVSYTYQSERLSGFAANGLSGFNDEDDSLDARFEYIFDRGGVNWRLFVAVSDLLKGSDDPDTLTYQGTESYKLYDGGSYFGGRTFSAGVTAIF